MSLRLPQSTAAKKEKLLLVALLLSLGAAMVLTNPWFAAVDDECAIIDRAAQPVSYTLHRYLSGVGEHEHPPLYDLILHLWLLATHGNMYLLRLPAIAFYLLGIWTLAVAAKHLAGPRAQVWVVVLASLSPFGFHFGRVATWYSFCFLLVSLLTLTYIRYVEEQTVVNWLCLVVSALLLVYSNYFGWAFVGLLLLDLIVRDARSCARQWKRLTAGGAALILAYLPLSLAFEREIREGVHSSFSIVRELLTAIYNLYCLFVSEAVAPWFWALGVIAGICVAIVLVTTLSRTEGPARRFFLYFCVLFAALTVLGVVETKRLLFISPWLLLPIAAMLATRPTGCRMRQACLLSLAVVGGVGWYGTVSRNMYAAPHWVEPWPRIARQSADVVDSGGVVIGDNPSFFFYMTYQLPAQPESRASGHFPGLLPFSTRRKGVYDFRQWLADKRPMASTILLVKGLHFGIPDAPIEKVERSLDAACKLRSARRLVHDPGAVWKQRFAPDTGELPWRIHILTYSCPTRSATARPDLPRNLKRSDANRGGPPVTGRRRPPQVRR